eukprot:1199341-Pyramimonas_sp.AAC.1
MSTRWCDASFLGHAPQSSFERTTATEVELMSCHAKLCNTAMWYDELYNAVQRYATLCNA